MHNLCLGTWKSPVEFSFYEQVDHKWNMKTGELKWSHFHSPDNRWIYLFWKKQLIKRVKRGYILKILDAVMASLTSMAETHMQKARKQKSIEKVGTVISTVKEKVKMGSHVKTSRILFRWLNFLTPPSCLPLLFFATKLFLISSHQSQLSCPRFLICSWLCLLCPFQYFFIFTCLFLR